MTTSYDILIFDAAGDQTAGIARRLEMYGATDMKLFPNEFNDDQYSFTYEFMAGRLANNQVSRDPVPEDVVGFDCLFEIHLSFFVAYDDEVREAAASRLASDLAHHYQLVLAYNDGQRELTRNTVAGGPLAPSPGVEEFVRDRWEHLGVQTILDGTQIEKRDKP